MSTDHFPDVKKKVPAVVGPVLSEGLCPLPEPWRAGDLKPDTQVYTADACWFYAARAVAEGRDCRTCRNFRGTQHCHSILRCIDGSSYQRGGVVQLWEEAPIEPAPF